MRARQDDAVDTQMAVGAEDVPVAAKPRRRTYTAEYKRRLLKEADSGTTPGQSAPYSGGRGCTRRICWSGAERKRAEAANQA
jgi:hypothetical protein